MKETKKIKAEENILEATNDFDLEKEKLAPPSTIKTQLKKAQSLLDSDVKFAKRNNFDRLKIALNLLLYGEAVGFEDFGLDEDVEEPYKRPSYPYDKDECDAFSFEAEEEEEEEEEENSDFIDFEFDTEELEKYEEMMELKKLERPNLFTSRKIKRRIPYVIYKEQIGLNNIYIQNGLFIIDITGKWMAENGVLGSLQKDNIHQALQKVLELQVVTFNVNLFIKYAQIFLCDVCVDVEFASVEKCKKVLCGISSFFPLATNKYGIKKYGRQGLMLIPKAKKKGYLLSVYHKGAELQFHCKRLTKAEAYTLVIGKKGQELAKQTIRFEIKLKNFDIIRKTLNLSDIKKNYVPLIDVLDSTAPVMLKEFENFSGTAEKLSECLTWRKNIIEDDSKFSLIEMLAIERFVLLLKENCYDLQILKSHLITEYPQAKESELEKINALANARKNILEFLTYHKPKSITILLDVIRRLQKYYVDSETTE
ncbi:MAG: hypothetical protein K6C94_06555 [Candidatus Gastranaerophilales bacterium]|nr:hypothetical protein [Candidatus Gastranaerophilales bacterium]